MTTAGTRIMVGVDFSHNSDRALQHAVALAKKLEGTLLLCYVGEPPPTVMVPEQLVERQIDYAGFYEQQLRGLRDEKLPQGVPCETFLVLGDPVREMLELIDRQKPDLVVVGSHGRGAILRALLGSVSTELCRRSPVPVLVVPTPERSRGANLFPSALAAEASRSGAP